MFALVFTSALPYLVVGVTICLAIVTGIFLWKSLVMLLNPSEESIFYPFQVRDRLIARERTLLKNIVDADEDLAEERLSQADHDTTVGEFRRELGRVMAELDSQGNSHFAEAEALLANHGDVVEGSVEADDDNAKADNAEAVEADGNNAEVADA